MADARGPRVTAASGAAPSGAAMAGAPEADGPAAGALLALWNDVTPGLEPDYEQWHAGEHVPERLTVPGIEWALRFRRDDDGTGPLRQRRFLTLYGLRDVAVLESAPYRRLLAAPTPASARMRPHLLNVSRWVCRVRERRGTGFAALPPSEAGVPTPDAAASIAVLAVLPAGHEGPARDALASAESGGARQWLLARRCPEAAPLPWLAATHAAPVDGDWLAAWAVPAATSNDPRPARCAPAVRYLRLPIGAR
ncbi:MAG: hypothetical protein AB7G13_16610 [Lautropia sp.]